MASTSKAAVASPRHGNIQAMFVAGEKDIGRMRTENLFKELDERALTKTEQDIIRQRTELQRRMLQEYEKRERLRKIRELQELCADLDDECAERALEWCKWKEDEAALRVSSDAAFKRRVLAGVPPPAPARVRVPATDASRQVAPARPVVWKRPAEAGAVDTSGVYLKKAFRSKLGPQQAKAYQEQQQRLLKAAADGTPPPTLPPLGGAAAQTAAVRPTHRGGNAAAGGRLPPAAARRRRRRAQESSEDEVPASEDDSETETEVTDEEAEVEEEEATVPRRARSVMAGRRGRQITALASGGVHPLPSPGPPAAPADATESSDEALVGGGSSGDLMDMDDEEIAGQGSGDAMLEAEEEEGEEGEAEGHREAGLITGIDEDDGFLYEDHPMGIVYDSQAGTSVPQLQVHPAMTAAAAAVAAAAAAATPDDGLAAAACTSQAAKDLRERPCRGGLVPAWASNRSKRSPSPSTAAKSPRYQYAIMKESPGGTAVPLTESELGALQQEVEVAGDSRAVEQQLPLAMELLVTSQHCTMAPQPASRHMLQAAHGPQHPVPEQPNGPPVTSRGLPMTAAVAEAEAEPAQPPTMLAPTASGAAAATAAAGLSSDGCRPVRLTEPVRSGSAAGTAVLMTPAAAAVAADGVATSVLCPAPTAPAVDSQQAGGSVPTQAAGSSALKRTAQPAGRAASATGDEGASDDDDFQAPRGPAAAVKPVPQRATRSAAAVQAVAQAASNSSEDADGPEEDDDFEMPRFKRSRTTQGMPRKPAAVAVPPPVPFTRRTRAAAAAATATPTTPTPAKAAKSAPQAPAVPVAVAAGNEATGAGDTSAASAATATDVAVAGAALCPERRLSDARANEEAMGEEQQASGAGRLPVMDTEPAAQAGAGPGSTAAAQGRSCGSSRAATGGGRSGKGHRGRVRQAGSRKAELMELGKLNSGAGWYNDGYIFPEGYKSRIAFRSSVELEANCYHECEILGEGGEFWPAPTYKVTALDRPDEPFYTKSCTGCWTAVLRRINGVIEARIAAGEDRPPPPKTAIAGPEYFGLNQVEVVEAIEQLDPDHTLRTYWEGKEGRLAKLAGRSSGNGPSAPSSRASRTSRSLSEGTRSGGRSSGGAARRRGRGGSGGSEEEEEDAPRDGDAGEDEEAYAGNKWSAIGRSARYRKRCVDAGDERGGGVDRDNPLPGFIDPITLEPVINPAISPYGHVMGLATWKAVLAEHHRCPFTKQPLNTAQCTVLNHNNIERHRSRIIQQ